ncbi:MAG: hypothetical protein AMJ67_08275 [Betaproteobacteria bacterium SG8_41]|jgi:hypothetical protein|nr:MAG: hypothetical protein AMJ67_08275 [Betaproteobacteria bacterium SG8_41]
MSTEKNGDAFIEKAKARLASGFVGEEDLEEASTPQKDLISACVIGAVAIGAMVLAWQMPDPGRSVFTHPGLLPFVVSLTMLAMAIGLAVRALREGGATNFLSVFSRSSDPEEREYGWRSWLLIAFVIALVVAIDVVTFRIRIPVGGIELRLSSFECVAIPIVTVIMKIYWGRSWWRCFAVAAAAALLLASAFRYGFRIPMPGVY